jgi:hypothetical protein
MKVPKSFRRLKLRVMFILLLWARSLSKRMCLL